MEKKVSIIVPVYNSRDTIGRCAESLLNQSLEEIELLFVDDCSVDDGYHLLQLLEKRYLGKVRLFQTEQNMGPGGARNLGLANAKGEYIGFVDSDDLVDAAMFEKMYLKAKESNATIVDCAFIDEESQCIFRTIPPECTGVLNSQKRNLLISREGYVWNKIFRRSFLEKNKLLFRSGVIMEDTDFVLHVYALAERMEYLDEALYRHTHNEKSLMHVAPPGRIFEQSKQAMVAIYERMSKLPEYEQLREGTEAFLISLYLSAIINICVRKDITDDVKQKNLMELQKMKIRMITGGYENPYLLESIDENCKEIMRMNETGQLLHLLQ